MRLRQEEGGGRGIEREESVRSIVFWNICPDGAQSIVFLFFCFFVFVFLFLFKMLKS